MITEGFEGGAGVGVGVAVGAGGEVGDGNGVAVWRASVVGLGEVADGLTVEIAVTSSEVAVSRTVDVTARLKTVLGVGRGSTVARDWPQLTNKQAMIATIPTQSIPCLIISAPRATCHSQYLDF